MDKAPHKKMDDDTLRSVLRSHLEESTNYYDATFSHDRVKADALYNGDPFGNEIKGRSSVVSRDVAESVDTIMPSLMRIFTTSDEAVRFNPTRPGEEMLAEQMTDYCNYIFNQRNEGYSNFYAWFKSALLYRIGVLKVWWDDTPETRKEEYGGLSEDQYQALSADPDFEIDEEKVYPDPMALRSILNHYKMSVVQAGVHNAPIPPEPQIDEEQLPKLYDCKVTRTISDGRVKIKPVPTEDFIFGKVTTSANDRPFFAHRTRMTASDLRTMGFDEDLIEQISTNAWNDASLSFEKEQRFQKENSLILDDSVTGDPSLDATWVFECYGKIDYDGDGVAEYRKITVAGADTEYVILSNEEIEDHPFAILTPVPMPFKLVGMSITDQTREIQEVKTMMTRQLMDNFYLSTHARPIINADNVNIDDILNPRPGSPIRAKNPQADVMFMQPPQIGSEALAAIEYWDTVRETRTGVTRFNQGLNADELNPTATGAIATMNAGNMRLELIARNFAETGVKRAFERIYSLVSQHQSRPDIVKLRGGYVTLLPTEVDANFDVTCSVGLGTGNRDQEFAKLMQLIQLDQTILAAQVSAGYPPGMGPVVNLQNVYAKLRRVAEVAGLKSPEQYYSDPMKSNVKPNPQKPPPPQIQAAQIAAQTDQAQLQERQREFDHKHGLATEKEQHDFAMKMQKLQSDHALRMSALQIDAEKNHVNAHLAAAQHKTAVGIQGVQDGHSAAQALMDHHVALNPPQPPQQPFPSPTDDGASPV